MIRVRLAAAASWSEVEYRPGMRVKDIFEILKYHPASIGHISVNGFPAGEDAELRDGDEVILVPVLDGG
jgi:sulfur carrier protein ThiS